MRQPWQDETAARLTEVEQEVGPLLVRDLAVRVVRVLALLERDDQALVLRLRHVALEVVVHGLCADDEAESALLRGVHELQDEALHVGRPALVEPEVGRVGLPAGAIGCRRTRA